MKLDPFLEIENKYSLIQDEIDGFAYWTYFRCDLKWELEQLEASCDEIYVYPKRSAWHHLKTRVESLKSALLFGRLPRKRHDMLIFNHERRVWLEDHYECIYTDQIAQMYPDSVVLERPYFQQHYRPVKTRNLVYTDYLEIKVALVLYLERLLHKRRIEQLKERLREKISKPLEELCGIYQITYRADSILEKMVCGYIEYQVKRKAFGKVLNQVRPKVILEVVGYDLDCMVINELAYERDIPTIELQHGTTGPEHIPYNYYPGTKVVQAPQYFFAFSRFWIDVARHPMPKERQIEIGFPYLDRRMAEVGRTVKRSVPLQIIFISQYPIGKELSDIAVTLNKIMDSEKYQIVYKLHPGEYEGWRERYPALAASDIKVYDDNHADLYGLLAASTYQIGAYCSTATFEGLAFHLKTYVLRNGALAELKLLCEKQLAQFFDTAEELYRLILEDEEMPEPSFQFWKTNALENVRREISAIVKDD